ncbi:MAG TPA: permease-like cell division protein FtsX [Bacillota bacterium]|nr:permease-like cell division protein FtsX [Bacillota bacterium]
MKVKTLGYFAKEASTGLIRNGLMSFAAVTTITFSLIILGCFYIVISNFTHFAEMAKGVLELRVYLKEEADPDSLQATINQFPGVKSIEFVSKEEGAKWLEKSLGVENIFVTADNPLPDMLDIKIDEKTKVKQLVNRVNALAGVDEVAYGQTFVEAMMIIIQIIWILGISLVVIISFVVLYIIVNTIRLTVLARWREIEIMKLVGATDWFIRWPFMLEGIILGLGGSLLTFLLLSKVYYFLYTYITHAAPFIPLLSERVVNNGLFWIISVVGVAFGSIGSMWSIKKFLRV